MIRSTSYQSLPSVTLLTSFTDAILALKERKGSSRQAIKKYILANNKVTQGAHFDSQINAAIKRGHGKGIFQLPKGKIIGPHS